MLVKAVCSTRLSIVCYLLFTNLIRKTKQLIVLINIDDKIQKEGGRQKAEVGNAGSRLYSNYWIG